MLKEQLLIEISSLLKVSPPFRSCNISIPRLELKKILVKLQDYEKPKNFKPKGERPPSNLCPSEANTNYRKIMGEYIGLNTGIEIPVSSGVPSNFYNAIANYLGL